jgi:hypothetical protein
VTVGKKNSPVITIPLMIYVSNLLEMMVARISKNEVSFTNIPEIIPKLYAKVGFRRDVNA